MDFEKPHDYVDALKRLEGFPLMGSAVELLFKDEDIDD